jgi:hypothetical protein
MRYAILCVLLFGCGSVPVELEHANAIQRQAAEAIEADYQALVDASTSEIERMGQTILDAEAERQWEASASDGMIAISEAKRIATWAAGERDKIREARETKRKQLRASPNLELLKEMNTAMRDYLVSVGGATREIERILGLQQKAKK